jgi:hypothetical protein
MICFGFHFCGCVNELQDTKEEVLTDLFVAWGRQAGGEDAAFSWHSLNFDTSYFSAER